jgi:hypothetical protein
MTQTDLWRLMRLPSASVSRWITGRYTPTVKNCVAIADALAIDRAQVLRRAGHIPLPQIANAPPRQLSLRGHLAEAMRRAAELEEYEELPLVRDETGADERVYWRPRRYPRAPGNRFAGEVGTDDLAPAICVGDLIIIDPDARLRPNCIIALKVGAEYQVQRLVLLHPGELVLESATGRSRLARDDGRLAGVVVAVQREFDS